MDVVDRADEQSQFHLDQQINKIRQDAKAQTRRNLKKGTCNYCGESIEAERVFCDSDCSEDFEKLERARQHKRV